MGQLSQRNSELNLSGALCKNPQVLEKLGTLVLDTSIPDEKLRERIFAQLRMWG